MGRKRQRHAGPTTVCDAPVPTEKLPSARESTNHESTKKRQKKTLQLKVISRQGANANGKKPDEKPKAIAEEKAPVAVKSTTTNDSNGKTDNEAKRTKKKKNKKNKNKSSANGSGNGTAAPPDASLTKTANTAEIDDLFDSLKTKKHESALAAEKKKHEDAQARKRERKEREQYEEQVKMLEAQNTNFTAVQGKNPDPRPLRYDEDGLPIYSEEALQIGKGGDTADCPFDCWCCF